MANEDNSSLEHSISATEDCDSNESFVKKVKSRVSEFIPSSLSKWFSSSDDRSKPVRHRKDDEDDEESFSLQPPSKRFKIPTGDCYMNNSFQFSTPINVAAAPQLSFSKNNVSVNKAKFNHFPEPQAGPSGVKSRKLLINKCSTPTVAVNGEKDSDSGNDSSASECSVSALAQLGHKEPLDSTEEKDTSIANKSKKLNSSFPVNSRSLFTNSHAPNTSLSSRRPSFNPSMFGSPNLVDRTISTKRITSSPFYNGCTIYGGASAYDRQLGHNPSDLRTQMKNTVQVKPLNQTMVNSTTMLSKTAKRILNTLEQYASSTTEDAKKIPYPAKKSRTGMLSKFTGAKPYMMRHSSSASNNELQVPTVPELLKMKERLQSSTVSVRKIATTSKSSLNEEYKIRTEEDNSIKHTNKIKSKVTSTRHKQVVDEPVEEVKLPNVPLPISTFPKFDFSLPPPVGYTKIIEKSPTKGRATTINKETEIKSPSKDRMEFKFSNPLVIAENLKSIRAINNYIFSEPLSKNHTTTCNFKSTSSNFVPLKKVNKNNGETVIQPSLMLSSGSVMDVLGKKELTTDNLMEKFKPATGTWECLVCMIRNLPDKTKCEACTTPKPEAKQETTTKVSNSPMIIAKSDKWECSSCWVKNNSSDQNCIACTSPRIPKANQTSVATDNSCKALKTDTKSLIKNDFGDAFKKSTNEWVCDTCMVRNTNTNVKCLCCESPKPGAKDINLDKKVQQSNFIFGIENSKIDVHGFTFGIKPDANVEKSSPSVSSIFGSNKPTSSVTTTGFSFGIKPIGYQSEIKPVDATKTDHGKMTESKPVVTNAMFGDKLAEKKPELTTILQNTSSVPQNESRSSNKDNVERNSSKNADSVFGFVNSTSTEVPIKVTCNKKISDDPLKKEAALSVETSKEAKSLFSVNSTVTTTSSNTNLFGFGLKRTAPTESLFSTNVQTKPVVKSIFKTTADSSTCVSEGPSFSFNVAQNATGSTSGIAVTASIQDGQRESKSFAFGGNSNESPNKVQAFPFGQESAKPIELPKTFSFSGGSTNTAPAFSFGASPANPAPSVGGFSFNKISQAPTSAFNQQPSLFAVPASGLFETPVPAQNFATPTTSTPIFTQPAQNGGFNFGANNTFGGSTKGGFSFGSSQSSTSAPTAPVFGFGAATAQQQASQGGFNFGTTAPPTFDANVKPTFNFTSGNVPSAFSAQPNTETTPMARKIRKAVRRTRARV